MNALTWEEDEAVAVGTYEEEPDNPPGLLDAAGEWILGHGKDFDVARPPKRPRSHLLAIHPYSSAPIGSAPWDRHVKAVDVSNVGDLVQAGKRTGAPVVVSAPLQQAAFAPPVTSMDAPQWVDPGVADAPVAVMAVIDDSINLTHERFGHGEGGPRTSRIDYAWVQDGAHCGAVPFGREITRQEIDDAIADAPDDEAALRALNLGLGGEARAAAMPRFGHGTHVLDIAAGAEPGKAAQSRRRRIAGDEPRVSAEDLGIADAGDDPDVSMQNLRIIAVELPRLVTRDTSGQQYCAFVMAAVHYILDRAYAIRCALKHPVPVVINFSYGIAGGPHNGGHPVEQAMEALLEDYPDPAISVIPSGNRNLGRGHASVHAAGGKTTSLPLRWRVPPGDETASFVEIWLPKNSGVTLDITLPDGTSHHFENLALPKMLRGADRTAVARVVSDTPALWAGKRDERMRVLLALAPTDPVEGGPRAPHGLWTICVTAEVPADSDHERIEAWILRDDTPLAHQVTGGVQSYFDDPHYKRLDCTGRPLARDPANTRSKVLRDGSLNGLATAPPTVVVKGYQTDMAGVRFAPYAGRPAPHMNVHPWAAQSDRSSARSGVLTAGVSSAGKVAINGTSVAAPQVARRLAFALMTGHTEVFDPKTPSTSLSSCADGSLEGMPALAPDPRMLEQS